MATQSPPEHPAVRPHSSELLVTVTSPAGWLALAACWTLIATALIWGIWGSVPTKVEGGGILVHTGGVLKVVTRGPGQVLAILVREGDLVHKDQVVAQITQPDLDVKLAHTRKELESLNKNYKFQKQVYEREWQIKVANFQVKRQDLQSKLGDLAKREHWLTKRRQEQQGLLQQGLITEKTLYDTQVQLQSAQEARRQALLDLKKVKEEELEFKNQQERNLFNEFEKILDAESRLSLLTEQLAYQTHVKSDFNGRVLETPVRVGDQLAAGDRIVTLEPLQPQLKAIVYIAAGLGGKKVEPGMNIQICPATVKRDEFGYILGRVTWVSPYPATQESMLSILGNEDLVKQFSKNHPPIVVHASPLTDSQTPSGLKWSSRQGPPFRITTGTLVSASVVVREQRPISLLIPYLKKFFGL